MEVKHKTNSSGMVNGSFMSSLNVENSLYDLSNEDEFYLYEVNLSVLSLLLYLSTIFFNNKSKKDIYI